MGLTWELSMLGNVGSPAPPTPPPDWLNQDLLFNKITTPVFFQGKFRGQRKLADYSPWGCKESDTTWRLNNNNNR